MATRKMTFTLPEVLASRFIKRVAAQDRSRYVAEAIAGRLAEHEQRLVRACEVANNDADVLEIEREFDALPSELNEPWSSAG